MSNNNFRQKVTESAVFKSFPKFRQDIFLRQKVLIRLEDLHGQAERLGIDYLRQNPSLTSSDIKLIKSML